MQESRRRIPGLARLLTFSAMLALAPEHAPRAGEREIPQAQPAAGAEPRASSPEARRPAPDEPEDPPEPPSFARDVMPALGRYCEPCHNHSEQHGGLRLDGYDGLMRGGDGGPVILPGNPQGSLLIAKIERRHRPPMPPRQKLPKPIITKFRAWIAAGATGQ